VGGPAEQMREDGCVGFARAGIDQYSVDRQFEVQACFRDAKNT
jgi:hypothetical protein